MTIIEMRNKRTKLLATMDGFLETHRTEKGVLSAEDDATYNSMEQELAALTNEIKRMERREEIEVELSKPVNTPITGKPMASGAATTPVNGRTRATVDLVNMFPELSELDLEWRKHSTSYKVNFFAYLDQLERYNFDLDEHRDPPYARWNDLNDNDKAIKWMLGRAIDRAFDELGDTYLYVRSKFYIPAEQIANCERI
jgi:hypothetical protein